MSVPLFLLLPNWDWMRRGESQQTRTEVEDIRLSGIHALLRGEARWVLQGKTKDLEEEVSSKTERGERVLKKERSRQKTGTLLLKAKQKLEGHLNYYAITDNGEGMRQLQIPDDETAL